MILVLGGITLAGLGVTAWAFVLEVARCREEWDLNCARAAGPRTIRYLAGLPRWVPCESMAGWCRCTLAAGHLGLHECEPVCGEVW